MNKFKLALWIIILGIIALVIFQNQTFFFGSQSLRVNLWVASEVQTPPIPIAVVLLIFFAFGLLLAWLFGLPERFRNRKAIKRLNALSAGQKDEIDNLQKQISVLKGETSAEGESAPQVEWDKAGEAQSGAGGDDPTPQADAPKS